MTPFPALMKPPILDISSLASQIGRIELSCVNAAIVLVALKFIAFLTFGLDKAKARSGARRIAESTLLKLAFFGGTLGAYAGRAVFRHKTRKQPFSVYLHTIATMQSLIFGGGLAWYLTRGA